MKLWLLLPALEVKKNDNPWHPWYNKAFGFVVRAETEQEAREFANSEAGNENQSTEDTKHPWLDEKYSTCFELTDDGEEGVVLRDFHAA
jgi:hypothetical protein